MNIYFMMMLRELAEIIQMKMLKTEFSTLFMFHKCEWTKMSPFKHGFQQRQ